MWLLNKLLGVIGDALGTSMVASDQDGIKDFTNSMNSLIDTLMSEQTQHDISGAVDSILQLLQAIATTGPFDSLTFGKILAVCQALARVAIDLAEQFVGFLIKLGRYLASKVVAFLEDPMDIPGISWLYEAITGDSLPSASAVICFAIAIPVTIIYKLIFNSAPFAAQLDTARLIAPSTMLSSTSDQAVHGVQGVLKLLFTGVGALSDVRAALKM